MALVSSGLLAGTDHVDTAIGCRSHNASGTRPGAGGRWPCDPQAEEVLLSYLSLLSLTVRTTGKASSKNQLNT